MPRVPQYNEQFRYAGRAENLGGRLNGGDFSSTATAIGAQGQAEGAGFQQMGAAITKAANIGAAVYDDFNTTKAQSAVNALQKGFLDWQSQMGQKKGQAGMNAAKDYDDWQKKQVAELTKDLNPIQRGRFAEMSTIKTAGFQKWASSYGYEQGQVYQLGEKQAAIETDTNVIAANPNNKEMIRSSLESIKQSQFEICQMQGSGKEATQVAMMNATSKALATSIDSAVAAGNIGAARGLLSSYGSDIDAQTRSKAEAAIQREAKRQAAEARANQARAVNEALMGMDEAKYAAKFMGDTSQLAGIAAQLHKLGDSKRADILDRQVSFWNANADAQNYAATAPLGELTTAINEADSALRDLQKKAQAEGADSKDVQAFQELSQKRAAWAEIGKERVQQLKADPALAADNDPSTVLPANPTAADKVTARLAYQEKNGVMELDRQPLTKTEQANVQAQWNKGSGDQKAALLSQLQQEFGGYTPQVLAQLNISPAEQDMAQAVLRNPTAAPHATKAFSIMALDGEKDIPKVTVFQKDVDDLLARCDVYQARMEMMKKATKVPPEVGQYLKQTSEIVTRMVKLGYKDDEIISTINLGRSAIIDNNKAITIPPEQDATAVSIGLNMAMNARLPDILKNRTDLNQYTRKDELRRLQQTGLWVDAPDGDGYIFMDPVLGKPVTDSKGKPLTVKEKDLFDKSGDYYFGNYQSPLPYDAFNAGVY